MTKLDLCVLGSGSSGNCSLLRLGHDQWVMIDAGFSMKQTKERMRTHGITLDMVDDVLLTHLDRDHFNPTWCRTMKNRGTRVHVHRDHVARATHAGIAEECLVPFDEHIDLYGINVETVSFAHDVLGTIGFIFDTGHLRLGYATDLGYVPQQLLDRFMNLDAIVLESNYDPIMQRTSNRPQSLIDRIMDGEGHLSNEQSITAIRHIANRSNLQHIVLLHLSRECNSPTLIRELYEDNLPHLLNSLTITKQDRCSGLLSITRQPEVTRA